MTTEVTIFILIYLLTLLLAATEMVPMSVAALVGALLTVWFGLSYGVFTYSEAVNFIDMKLIGLIVGTMIVVEVAYRGGLFRVIALYAVKAAGGDPKKLFILICVTAAGVSMVLSDPTALLLIAAAAITISKVMGYDPTPYFLSATIMINLGGTSTLIGSVSNMIIGMTAGFSFTDFINYLAPCELTLWVLTILTLYIFYKPRLGEAKELPSYSPWEGIEDKKKLVASTLPLIILLILFVFQDSLGVGLEAVALGCAVLALAISGFDPSEIFRRIDWETVFFLGGFFFVVGGMEKTGFLTQVSNILVKLAGENSFLTPMLTLWLSGLMSTVVSNIAIALTFVPIIQGLQSSNMPALWSALVLGTNLGGAATPLSGAVCVMAVGALKREGITLSFGDFTKVGTLTTLVQLGFATAYLIFRFGVGG